MIKPIPSMGIPMLRSTMARVTMPAPGVPAVPMEARVAVTTTVSCWVRLRSRP